MQILAYFGLGSGSCVFFFIKNDREVRQFVEAIEEQVVVELPNGKEYKTFDFRSWEEFGNTVHVNIMSYIVFQDNQRLSDFEDNLTHDLHWTSDVTEQLRATIPVDIHAYLDRGDYVLLYNIDRESYQIGIDSEMSNHYILLIYQMQNNRLIVFDYLFQKG